MLNIFIIFNGSTQITARIVRSHMEPHGGVWSHTGPYGAVWGRIELYNHRGYGQLEVGDFLRNLNLC